MIFGKAPSIDALHCFKDVLLPSVTGAAQMGARDVDNTASSLKETLDNMAGKVGLLQRDNGMGMGIKSGSTGGKESAFKEMRFTAERSYDVSCIYLAAILLCPRRDTTKTKTKTKTENGMRKSWLSRCSLAQ